MMNDEHTELHFSRTLDEIGQIGRLQMDSICVPHLNRSSLETGNQNSLILGVHC